MRIAIASDMSTKLTQSVVENVTERGHEVVLFGPLAGRESHWAEVAIEAAGHVSRGEVDQAILFCWTGTGVTLAANKLRGVRAALCGDRETAEGARQWNDANILSMSLRLVSEHVAKEMLDAWFSTEVSEDPEDTECLEFLERFEGHAAQLAS